MEDVFREKYASLSDEQKQQMADVKTKAKELLTEFYKIVPDGERSERSRCMALAKTNLEQSIMWAVKGVTTAQGGE